MKILTYSVLSVRSMFAFAISEIAVPMKCFLRTGFVYTAISKNVELGFVACCILLFAFQARNALWVNALNVFTIGEGHAMGFRVLEP